MDGVKDHHGDFISRKEYWIQGSKMKYEMGRKEKDLSASKDGVDFWNRMIALLTYRLHSKLPIKASGIISKDKTLLSEKKTLQMARIFMGKRGWYIQVEDGQWCDRWSIQIWT